MEMELSAVRINFCLSFVPLLFGCLTLPQSTFSVVIVKVKISDEDHINDDCLFLALKHCQSKLFHICGLITLQRHYRYQNLQYTILEYIHNNIQ